MDLYAMREEFSREGIVMCFNGPFSHSIIEEIGIAVRRHLIAENVEVSAMQDVFAVYIEMSQNARNYIATHKITAAGSDSATIVVSKKGDYYSVTLGNFIRKADAEELASRIDSIAPLDRDELKKRIKRQLRQEVPPGALGAGIGLMEMAKRSTGGLSYYIRDIDVECSFFTLTAKIQGEA